MLNNIIASAFPKVIRQFIICYIQAVQNDYQDASIFQN